MSMDVIVTVTLDAVDAAAVSQFEEKFRAWARTQPAVKAVSMSQPGHWDGSVWREARKAEFGSKLGNPFGRTHLE
ncbi:MAG TPA: hypothetical protein VD978_37350 [Azospirillum sp.]|nr:hypothetical protein [Azospirillum sp.]